MTNLVSILKSRDITLPTKVYLVKAMFFPVVMYGCESWTINKAECLRTGCWIVVLEKTLENPLYFKQIKPVTPKGNQPWIFFGRTDIEAEAPIPWPPNAKSWLIGKDPDAGKDCKRRNGEQRMTWLDSHTDSMDMNLDKFQEIVKDREASMGSQSQTQFSDWTTTTT